MTRAYLTDGERGAVKDDPDIDAATKSTHLSRVRAKIDPMRTDARLLRKHQPDLYEELRAAIVEEELEERVEQLETEMEVLREKVEDLED